MISRSGFEAACIAFLSSSGPSPEPLLSSSSSAFGWTWSSHPTAKGYGQLSKWLQRTCRRDRVAAEEGDPDLVEEADAVALDAQEAPSFINVELSVAYSATFQVPVLYFRGFDLGGTPLPIERLLHSSLFHQHTTQDYPFASSQSDNTASFPIISASENPSTSLSSYFLHPCNTSSLLTEVLDNTPVSPDEDASARYLQAWLMIVSSLVNLR